MLDFLNSIIPLWASSFLGQLAIGWLVTGILVFILEIVLDASFSDEFMWQTRNINSALSFWLLLFACVGAFPLVVLFEIFGRPTHPKR